MASIIDIKKETETKIHNALEFFKKEISRLRTGRAHTGLIDDMPVEVYGAKQALKQVAKINVLDAQRLKISPFDKSQIQSIEKSIRESDLGINPTTTGTDIILSLPPLTGERRAELIKVLGKDTEAVKVEIRNIRREANDGIKKLLKDKDISEDEERRAIEEVQKIIDKAIEDAEKLAEEKEKELKTV